MSDDTKTDDINVWANILAKVTIDDEQAKQREYEWRASFIDEWWSQTRKNIPSWKFARFGNKVWESKCDPRVLRAVREWSPMKLTNGKLVAHSMVVCAQSGSGKSTAILARLYETSKRLKDATIEGRSTVRYPPGILWVTEQQLLSAQDERNFQLMNDAREVSMLVLDEFGFAGGHDAIKGRTPVGLDILGNRYDQELATVVTSGLSLAQLGKRYGVAITRRMENQAKVVDLLRGGQ